MSLQEIVKGRDGAALKAALAVTTHGREVNVRDEAGDTPLEIACTLGEPELVMLLLQHGADPNLEDADSGFVFDFFFIFGVSKLKR